MSSSLVLSNSPGVTLASFCRLENMNGSELFGRVLKVNLAKPQVNRTKPVWAEADEWYSGLKAGADAEAAEEGK
jgi:hypothetical protein